MSYTNECKVRCLINAIKRQVYGKTYLFGAIFAPDVHVYIIGDYLPVEISCEHHSSGFRWHYVYTMSCFELDQCSINNLEEKIAGHIADDFVHSYIRKIERDRNGKEI